MSQLIREVSDTKIGNLSVRLETPKVVLPRREKFLAKHGVDPKECVFMETTHGDVIAQVESLDQGLMITAEALITNIPGVILYLLTGDCFPVSFYDPVKKVIALAHMGWKPTDKQLATKVIGEMEDRYYSWAKDLQVFLGPGIHKKSYRFPELIHPYESDWSPFLTTLPSGEILVDVQANIVDQCLRSGVQRKNITLSSVNTAEDRTYFSHYRSVRTGEPEGRFATILGMRN